MVLNYSDIEIGLSFKFVYDIVFKGSDTTARIFGAIKAIVLEKVINNKYIQAASNIFSLDGS